MPRGSKNAAAFASLLLHTLTVNISYDESMIHCTLKKFILNNTLAIRDSIQIYIDILIWAKDKIIHTKRKH